ncbi:MAG: hypothetical protein N2037_02245 [Acidimicrobiales bacterium]|nr:hypothetical protein [Acidimicrobiales bacterium]
MEGENAMGGRFGSSRDVGAAVALALLLIALGGSLLASVPGLAASGPVVGAVAAVAGWVLLGLAALVMNRPTWGFFAAAAVAGGLIAVVRLALFVVNATDAPSAPAVAQVLLGLLVVGVAGGQRFLPQRAVRLRGGFPVAVGALSMLGATAVLAVPTASDSTGHEHAPASSAQATGAGPGELAAELHSRGGATGSGRHGHDPGGSHSHDGDGEHSDDHGGHADGSTEHSHAPGSGHVHDPLDPGHVHDPLDPGHVHDPLDPGHGHSGFGPNAIAIDYGPADRCDIGFNPVSYYRDATIAGVDFINGPTPQELNAPHTMSEVEAAKLVQQLADGSDEAYFEWLRGGHQHGPASAASAGHDAHFGPQAWKAMTDPAQCALLAEQLRIARSVALSYPTARDAERAGYQRTTPYVIGIAAHYVKDSLIDAVFDPAQPEMLLYDGNGPDARIVGLSYEIYHEADTEPSVGFAGRNDRYHRHTTLCMKDGVTIGDSTMTKEQCEALGGKIFDGRYYWMSHAWVVPGCESPWGVFSQVNPLLDLQLGNASGFTTGCAASSVRHRYNLAPAVRDATLTAGVPVFVPQVSVTCVSGVRAARRRCLRSRGKGNQ